MKLAAIVSAAALAAVTKADMCDVKPLQEVLVSPDTKTCGEESGYVVTSLKTPTEAQLNVMCPIAACQSVLSQIKKLAPKECELGAFLLYDDLINPMTDYCKRAGSLNDGPMGPPDTTVKSDNASPNPTTSKVTEPDSKAPTTSDDHTYAFTPDAKDDTAVKRGPDSSENGKETATVKQTSGSPENGKDDATVKQGPTSSENSKDDATVKQGPTSSENGKNDATVKQTTSLPDNKDDTTTPTPDASDDNTVKPVTTPTGNSDDGPAETTSGATSVSMVAVWAGVFVVTVTTTIL
ncbi:unnamed protein product [Peronospora farinosa]|uniref:Elicitin-like protein n=1 Tax=Peronospora farinosa TaxID=134698 RepID=A0AAV0SU60_9STRA|nr:unnamed protein product [Peronospora farinosa]CAI5706028.1 unnamed protein product [Peronospora farinosa]